MNNKKYDNNYYSFREITDLKDMIITSSQQFRDLPAYLVKDRPGDNFRPISYGQVRKEMDGLGTALLGLGLKGKKIAVIGENSYPWVLTYFATVCGVGTIVPLDKKLPSEEIHNLIERAEVSAIVFSKSVEKNILNLTSGSNSIEYMISMSEPDADNSENHGAKTGGKYLYLPELIAVGEKSVKDGIRDYVDAEINPDDMCTLLFTSGTTGLAKGVMLSHSNIASNVYNMSKLVKIRKAGTGLSVLPMHHSYEMTCHILTCYYQGLSVAVCEGIKYIQKNLAEVEAAVMLGVPLIFEKMYKALWKQAEARGEAAKLRKAIEISRKGKLYNNTAIMKRMFKPVHTMLGNNMSLLIAGGAAIDPKVIEDFEAMGIPMIQGYGMTECAPIVAVNQDRYSKAASVGKPMPGTQVQIVDADENGIGEIICRGPSVMLGYYNDPDATAAVLREGWLHTGDYGYFDSEGFLYVTGRKKNVIVTKGGKNIFPEEVEYALLKNEYIEEVVVYGVNDERIGNTIVTASIFPNYKALAKDFGNMNGSDIYHFFRKAVDVINESMPPYKRVKRINIKDTQFEKTTTGKIKRYVMENEVRETERKQTIMNYAEIKQMEMNRAIEKAKQLNESKDRFLRYRTSRPITDIKHMIETSAQEYGDNVAFMQKFVKNEPFTSITYKEALADVNGLGTALINLGLKDKRIGIIGETCYQWESSYLAVLCGTGIVVPLDKELNANELEQLIIEADVSAIIFGKKYEEMFKTMKANGKTKLETLIGFETEDHGEVLSWKKLIEDGKNQIAVGDRQFLDAEIIADDMSIILFTSGTTGIAKGVMLSHENLVEDLMSAPTILNVNPWDIFFSVLPVHHTYECTCAFLMPLYKGAAIAYCEGLKYITKNLAEVKPTMLLGVPVLIESLYKKIWQNVRKQGKEKTLKTLLKLNRGTKKVGLDISKPFTKDILAVFGGRMRVLISGGAAINPEILQFFNDLGILAVQGYGLTECAPMAALNPDVPKDMRNDSVGHLLPGMEVKIIDKNEEGIGEICLKGKNVMMGYYNNEAATNEVIIDGWFHSGDLGYVDADNFIYITGRKKNVIITKNGKNVFPEEIEYYLGQVPYIAESMVWGAEDEDGSNDTTIVATVTLDKEEVAEALGESYDEEQVKALVWEEIDKINDTLPLFKRVKKLAIRNEDFEKTTSKKIKRFVDSNKQA
ncbi:MAG TPA: AMP-binding protein [Anaerovoracaceae bacterium]|nr:AMP-binding protein [Anaerovoracaceae bacterium]